jgi:hypothetical protein
MVSYDPDVARKYLDELLRKPAAKPPTALDVAIQALDRPAKARGLTQINVHALPTAANPAPMLPANYYRRMFTIVNQGATFFFFPTLPGYTPGVGEMYQQQQNNNAIFYKEEDWGALIWQPWQYTFSAIMATAWVFEEVYVT